MTGDRPISRGQGGGPISRAPCPDCGKVIANQCAGTVDRKDGTRHRCHHSARRGSTVCGGRGSHGGNARQVKAKAAERVAEAAAIEIYQRHRPDGDTSTIDVFAELAAIVAEVRGFKDFLGRQVERLTAAEWQPGHPGRDQARAEVRLYAEALDRTRIILTDIVKLGIEERAAASRGRLMLLERAKADRIVHGVEVALGKLDLTPRQWERAGPALRGVLLYLAGEESGDG